MEQQGKKKSSVVGTIGKALLGVGVALLAIGYCTDQTEGTEPAASEPASAAASAASGPAIAASMTPDAVASADRANEVQGQEASANQRPTFKETSKELAVKYNAILLGVAPELMIPSESNLNVTARNDRYYLIQEMVHEGVAITFEVDNVTDKPFSMGVVTATESEKQITNTMVALAGVGAAVFGQNEDAGAVARACTEAAKSEGKHHEMMVKGKQVWCGIAPTSLMAGVTEPKAK